MRTDTDAIRAQLPDMTREQILDVLEQCMQHIEDLRKTLGVTCYETVTIHAERG